MVVLKNIGNIILFNLFWLICSCSIVLNKNDKFNLRHKYNPSAKTIAKINTIGFYNIAINKGTSREYYLNFILFPDGICNWGFYQMDSVNTRNMINNVTKNSNILKAGDWGIYEVRGDTLTMVVKLPPWGMAHYSIHLEYSIKGTNLIWRTYENNVDFGKNTVNELAASQVSFCILDSIPSSDCWLKQKRWFWADKEAYKAYMKKLKEESKKK